MQDVDNNTVQLLEQPRDWDSEVEHVLGSARKEAHFSLLKTVHLQKTATGVETVPDTLRSWEHNQRAYRRSALSLWTASCAHSFSCFFPLVSIPFCTVARGQQEESQEFLCGFTRTLEARHFWSWEAWTWALFGKEGIEPDLLHPKLYVSWWDVKWNRPKKPPQNKNKTLTLIRS